MVSALVSLTDRFIRWPASEQSKQDIARKFDEKAGFPAVLGAIDGTHIQIHPQTNTRSHTATEKATTA